MIVMPFEGASGGNDDSRAEMEDERQERYRCTPKHEINHRLALSQKNNIGQDPACCLDPILGTSHVTVRSLTLCK